MAVSEYIEKENDVYFNNLNYDLKEILRHELKNPLASNIIMLSFLLNERFGKLSRVQKEIILSTISSEMYSLGVLNNCLFYDKNIPLFFEKHDIKRLLESAIDDLNLICRDKKQNIILNCEIKDCFLYADKKELSRVFYNLIMNLSELSENESNIFISVKNKDKNTEIIFKSEIYKNNFYKKRKDKFRKLSVDLSFDICKKITELHGGKFYINPFKNSDYIYKLIFNTVQ